MHKYCLCILTTALLLVFKAGHAQKTDSLKIDTNLLNRYRIDPPKDILPVQKRPVVLRREPIPVTPLGYEVSYWRKFFTIGLNLNQSAFSDNWSGGGVSSIAVGNNVDLKAEYNKQPLDFTPELVLIYGISKNKGQLARKTNDRIFFDNKLATQLSKHWYFFGAVSFESQFSQGFQYNNDALGNPNIPVLISKFMAPGYVTESVGIEYKPVKYLDIRLGTGTARQTFVLDTTIYHNIPGNYGVVPGNTFRNEIAFQGVATIDKDIATNMHLEARYALFIPYNNLKRIDDRLDAKLTARVNRLIAVTISGTLLYDITTSTSVQASQALALGVIYKFP